MPALTQANSGFAGCKVKMGEPRPSLMLAAGEAPAQLSPFS